MCQAQRDLLAATVATCAERQGLTFTIGGAWHFTPEDPVRDIYGADKYERLVTLKGPLRP